MDINPGRCPGLVCYTLSGLRCSALSGLRCSALLGLNQKGINSVSKQMMGEVRTNTEVWKRSSRLCEDLYKHFQDVMGMLLLITDN